MDPNSKSLNRSASAQYFGLDCSAEAFAYWEHPVLGLRLKEFYELILQVDGRSALDIFGSTNAMKLRSSMTLFAEAMPESTVFEAVRQQYCHGEKDAATLALLGH